MEWQEMNDVEAKGKIQQSQILLVNNRALIQTRIL